MIETIEECLKTGRPIQLTGFATFTVKETKARTMQSFGKEVHVEAGKRIGFKAGANLLAAVK